MRTLLVIVFFFVHTFVVCGQVFPLLQSQKFLGKYGDDIPMKILKASDGNLLIGGNSIVQTAEGNLQSNIWIIKVTPGGQTIWEEEVAMNGSQELRDMVATYEGGVIFAGVTSSMLRHSEGGDRAYWGDFFVGHLGVDGKTEWIQSYGGNRLDQAHAISRGLYREYMITGGSHSGEGDVSRNFGMSDVWMLKIDTKGNKRFSKVMGGIRNDWASALVTCKNGDYVMAGFTNSPDIVSESISIYGNGLLIRTNKTGQTLWTQTFPCPQGGYFSDVIEGKDGRLILAGNIRTQDRGSQFWVIKVTADGKKIWEKIMGGKSDDYLSSISECEDGGYILGGYSVGKSEGKYGKGGDDFWLIRIDKRGDIIWRNTYGGPNHERCRSVLAYAPGVIYAIGEKHNDFQEEGFRQRGKDFWLVRLEEKPCDSLQAGIFVRAKNYQALRDTRVRFKARCKYGEQFHWDFGDGTESSDKWPLKSYSLPGMYEVTLTVKMNEGCSQKVIMDDLLEIY